MGIVSDLTIEWIEEKVAIGTCERTGLPFSNNLDLTASKDPFAPSLDRINPGKGYTQDNVQVVCTVYMLAKSDWGDEPVVKMAVALLSASSYR